MGGAVNGGTAIAAWYLHENDVFKIARSHYDQATATWTQQADVYNYPDIFTNPSTQIPYTAALDNGRYVIGFDVVSISPTQLHSTFAVVYNSDGSVHTSQTNLWPSSTANREELYGLVSLPGGRFVSLIFEFAALPRFIITVTVNAVFCDSDLCDY